MSFGSKLHARRLRVGPRILAVTILAAHRWIGEGGFPHRATRSDPHQPAALQPLAVPHLLAVPHPLGNFDSSTDLSGNFTRFFCCRFSAS
jgi:hypothetical protein